MEKRLSVVLIICLFSLMAAGPVHAKIAVILSSDNALYSGACPADIKFKGTITVDKPVRVQYRFVRSDGALQPVETLEFSAPGTKEITATWTLHELGAAKYTGWQTIKILYPEEIESNKVNFGVTCDQTIPDLTVKIKHCPKTARPGHELGSSIKIIAINRGAIDERDVVVELIMKKDNSCPIPTPSAVYSPHFSNVVLMKHELVSLIGGQRQDVRFDRPYIIPSDVPLGDYFLCAVIDAGDKIKESNEANNCSCCPVKIMSGVGKPELLIERFSFKAGDKCEPNNPIYIFDVTVANIGTAPSPAMPDKVIVQVMDLHGTGWGNGTGLNSIPPGGRQTVSIPVYYFIDDPAHMAQMVPHPFRAVIDPHHIMDESKNNNKSDIIYLDPGNICPKVSSKRSSTSSAVREKKGWGLSQDVLVRFE